MGNSVRHDTQDWPQVVADIRRAGMMVKAIARSVGVAPTTLSSLQRGDTIEPCYSVGVRLLELRAKVK
jgi:transposase-like protein